MNADQITHQSTVPARRGLRRVLRTALSPVLRPYLRRRAETVGALARLDTELEHVRERHTEQIARLEDLACELVLSVEALRRASAAREAGCEE